MTTVNELYFNDYALDMFARISETALYFNKKNKFKRFHVINSKNGEFHSFGIYDADNSKYVITDTYNPNCEFHLKEMKNLVYSKSKKQKSND